MKHDKYWMALDQVKGVGPAMMREIHDALRRPGLSITDLFTLSPEEMRSELSLREQAISAVEAARGRLTLVEDGYFKLIDAGIEIVLFFEEGYPERLNRLMKNEAPSMLYVYGNRSLLREKSAAVLGEKAVSEKGELVAYRAAQELVRHRIAVTSGFARGVDLIAHRAALENGGGTIGVLPHGFSQLKMPDSMKEAYNPDFMLLVSPFGFDTEYSTFNAFRRNRLACALSRAVFIVESPADGGIYEAAKSARALGVPLYATEYAEYPDTAAGNPVIMRELGAQPVRGRLVNNALLPNLDRLIADVKFGD
ncbi:MAG: DNA-protecting protein DprA [Spirochaetes bacterium]|jgi:DNA processing protein|nr:DNA-protecting protein DprA [Spirochaetota bacterium]